MQKEDKDMHRHLAPTKRVTVVVAIALLALIPAYSEAEDLDAPSSVASVAQRHASQLASNAQELQNDAYELFNAESQRPGVRDTHRFDIDHTVDAAGHFEVEPSTAGEDPVLDARISCVFRAAQLVQGCNAASSRIPEFLSQARYWNGTSRSSTLLEDVNGWLNARDINSLAFASQHFQWALKECRKLDGCATDELDAIVKRTETLWEDFVALAKETKTELKRISDR